MQLRISAWAIRKPVTSVVMFFILTVLGLISFSNLPVTRFPNIDAPFINVIITQSGAAPAELETQVTKRVEDAVSGIANIKRISSKISDGVSATTIEFRLEVNSDRALNDVKDAIAKARPDLPRNIDEPSVQRLIIAGLPILTYSVASPNLSLEQLSWLVDDTISRDLQGVKGVSEIARIGGINREIRVQLNADRLLSLGITAADVNRQLKANHVDLAGGRGEVGGQEQAIRTLAGTKTIEQLAGLNIQLSGGRKVRLDDLGTVTDGQAEARTFARLDGQPIVAFSISRAVGASDVELADRLTLRIEKLQKANPQVEIKLIDTFVNYTKGNYKAAMQTLVEGALLAVLVVFLFLRDWRATLISAVALPLSVIPTFFVVELLNFSLNLVSLLALTLATGILVDDAIVEVENIVRHMKEGKSPYRASLEAADEIGLAVIAITFTIIAIFAPVSFMGGIAGQYFKQFGLVVAAAVFFSLVVARLITPILCAYFLRPHKEKAVVDGKMMQFYTRVIIWVSKHRFLTLVGGFLIFFLSVFYMKNYLPKGFIPAEDAARFLMVVELPPGSRLDDTVKVTNTITQMLHKRPEVKSIYIDGGRVLNGGREIRKASLIVNLVHKSQRSLSQRQLENAVMGDLNTIPDIRFWKLNDNGIRGLQLNILGDDTVLTGKIAAQIASEMKTLPMIQGAISTAALDRPEIIVRPKGDIAADLGISTEAIAETIRVGTIGDVAVNLAKFEIDTRQIAIRVQLDDSVRNNPSLLEALKVPSTKGAPVPLGVVADISFDQGPTSIERFNRKRKISLEADLFGTDALDDAVEKIKALPTAQKLPPGVEIAEAGDAEVGKEVAAGFIYAMSVGLMMVFAVLILLFGSFLHPITILLSLPLSLVGVILALVFTGKPITMPVYIGLLMLMGIVTKNAILLVDFAVESRLLQGISREQAIIDAGRKRARPIVMTTIAMAAGMLPSAFGLSDGGEFRSPMAVAVIGGLLVSTVLSLVFVPAFYLVMDDVSRFFTRIFTPFLGEEDDPDKVKV
jgi:hydrophobe/amphiphile efflux-1 (HAE1) family protein